MTPGKNWFTSLFSRDSRKATRTLTPPLVAYFWDGGEPVAHPVQDISPSGFFLNTTERWLLGTLVMMTLQRTTTLSDHPFCTVIVMSRVVRHGENGVGFAFVPVDAASEAHKTGPGATAASRKTLDHFLELLEEDQGYVSLGFISVLVFLFSMATHWTREAAVAIVPVLTVWLWHKPERARRCAETR